MAKPQLPTIYYSAIHHPRIPTWAPPLALLALTVIAFVPAVRAAFIWDDDYYITKNYNLRSAEGLANIWTKFGLIEGGTPQYYPITHTTFWIEHHLWGERAFGYHLVNILLHATSAILLWVILRRLEIPGAWVAAAIFAVHPVQVESVAWITERKNILSGFFYLSALLAYLPLAGFANPPARSTNKLAPYALTILLFTCALLSKSVTASLPAVILLLIWWKRARITARDVLPLLPLFALGIGMGWLTSHMEKTAVGASGAEWDLSFSQRILIAGRAVWFYLYKLLWPARLSFIYPRWQVNPHVAWQWLFPVAAAAVVVALFIARRRIGRAPLVAVLFFGGTLLPALGFVNVFPMRYSFVADHFQYLACIGIIVLIVALAARFGDRGVITPIAGIVLIALSALTFLRCFAYRDLKTLWADTLTKNPDSWMVNFNYGKALYTEDDLDGAEHYFTRAHELAPALPEISVNLGALYERRHQSQRAEAEYREAISASDDAVAHANLGRLLFQQGKIEQAEAELRRAIDLAPSAPAHHFLGLVFASRQRYDDAAREFREAIRLDPDLAEAHYSLGLTQELAGDRAAAADSYRQALEINPSFAAAERNLRRVTSRVSSSSPSTMP